MSELIKSEAEELMDYFKTFETAISYARQKMTNDPIFKESMLKAGVEGWVLRALPDMHAIEATTRQNQNMGKTRDFGLQQR